jgi:hypothetical protein
MKSKPKNEMEALAVETRKMIAEMIAEEGTAQVRAWAEVDTWSIKEGLLLISGIYPDGAEVEWNGNRLGGVHIQNAWPLGERITFLSVPAPTIKPGNLAELPDGGLIMTGGEIDLDEQKIRKLSVLRDLDQTLDRAQRLWIAGQHDGKRFPPSYFIEWAKSKGITVNGELERAVADHQPRESESADDAGGRVAWHAVMLDRWKEIMAAGKDNGRDAISWLKKNDTSGVFDKSCSLKNKFTWTDRAGQKHTTPIKTAQTRISEWRKAGKIPAKIK